MNQNKEIILEAKFDKISQININSKRFYQLTINKKSKLLNCFLEEIVPMQYEQFSATSYTNDTLLMVKIKNKYGVIDWNGKLLIEPIYDYIRLEKYNKTNYFHVKNENKHGILDNIGQPLFPFSDYYTGILGSRTQNSNSSGELQKLTETLFQTRDTKGLISIFNSNGKEILPERFFSIDYEIQKYDTYYIHFLKCKKDSSVYIYNLEGGLIHRQTNCEDLILNIEYNYSKNKYDTLVTEIVYKNSHRIANISEGTSKIIYNSEFQFGKGIIVLNPYGGINEIIDISLKSILKTKLQCNVSKSDAIRDSINVVYGHLDSTKTHMSCIIDFKGKILNPLQETYRINFSGKNNQKLIWIFSSYQKLMDEYYESVIDSLEIIDFDGKKLLSIDITDYRYDYFFNQHYSADSYSIRYGDTYYYLDSSLLFVKSKGKWGGINEFGKLIVPFIYDTLLRENFKKLNRTDSKLTGYYLKKKGKIGVINLDGSVKIPFKYNEYKEDYYNEFDLLKKRKYYELRDSVDNVIITKADSIFIRKYPDDWTKNYPYNKKKKIGEYQLIASQKGYLYAWEDNIFKRMDTANWKQLKEPVTQITNFLINENGKITFEGEKYSSLYKCPNHFICIGNSSAYTVNKKGEKLLKLENFHAAQVEFGYLSIKFKDSLVGLLAEDGTDWLIKPNYYAIKHTQGIHFMNKFWVKTTPLVNEISKDGYYEKKEITQIGGWQLIDKNGKVLSGNELFKIPILVNQQVNLGNKLDYYPIYQTDSLFGILDTAYTIILDAAFEKIYRIENTNFFALKQGNIWKIYHPIHGMQNGNYSNVSFSTNNNIIEVYTHNDSAIAIVKLDNQDGFKMLCEMKSIDDFFADENLPSYYGLNISNEKGLPMFNLDTTRTDLVKYITKLINEIIYYSRSKIMVNKIYSYAESYSLIIDFSDDYFLNYLNLPKVFYPSTTNNRNENLIVQIM
jgi:hypothetical protein